MSQQRMIAKGTAIPFALLSVLFFAWAIPNNMTDTMLAAFKRIMSLSDSKTAWIQVVCYLLGYGCFAIPGALFIKRHTYKSGVLLGLSLYALGGFLFLPAKICSQTNIGVSYYLFLLAIFVLFAGLSILETSANSYVCEIGPSETATRRLNFAQSFNPFGAITGVIVSQAFVLSKLNTMNAQERALLSAEQLSVIQDKELNAVTTAYVVLASVMVVLFILIAITKMPPLKEDDKTLDFKNTLKRLLHNKRYVLSVIAQFFYVGAQIAVWSFVIRYAMAQMNFDAVIASLGEGATQGQIIDAIRNMEPVAGAFYSFCDFIGLDALLPRTPEQAGATYYIMSLALFVFFRFVCTWLMKYFKPAKLLVFFSLLAVACCCVTIFGKGVTGVYTLMMISGCMSLMFPTIYGIGVEGLGEDTKIGGSGMVMAIAGAAVLTQIQGIVSDQSGSIETAYIIPAIAFALIASYGIYALHKLVGKTA